MNIEDPKYEASMTTGGHNTQRSEVYQPIFDGRA